MDVLISLLALAGGGGIVFTFKFLINLYLKNNYERLKKNIKNTTSELNLKIKKETEHLNEDKHVKQMLVKGKYKNIRIDIELNVSMKTGYSEIAIDLEFKPVENNKFSLEYRNDPLGLIENDNSGNLLITGDESFDNTFVFHTGSNIYIPVLFGNKLRNRLNYFTLDSKYIRIRQNKISVMYYSAGLRFGIPFSDFLKELVVLADIVRNFRFNFNSISENIKNEKVFNAKLKMIEALCMLPDEIKKIERLCIEIMKKYKKDYASVNDRTSLENYKAIKTVCVKAQGEDGALELIKIMFENKGDENNRDTISFILNRYFKTFKKDIIKLYIAERNHELKKHIINHFILRKEQGLNDIVANEISNYKIFDRVQIELLGKCGKKEHVEVLYDFGERTTDEIYKKACRENIAKIQSRLGSAEKGWISITDNDKLDGALSKNDLHKKGQLSKGEA